MAPKSKIDQLRNKFLNVEMSLEESEMKFIQPTNEIQKNKAVINSDIPILFLYGGFFVRALKIILYVVEKSLLTFWTEVMFPVAKEIQKTLTYSRNKVTAIKEHREIFLEEYLSKIEDDLVKKKETSKKNNQNSENVFVSYKEELAQMFEGIPNNVEFVCEKKELGKVNTSLEFDISLYELILLKLTSSKMLTNITELKIKSVVSDKDITNTVEVDLKISGEKWSMLFSKHIASEVFNKIINYGGKVKNHHLLNLAKKSETFVFVFTHQRLDVYVGSAREEKTSGVGKCKEVSRNDRFISIGA